MWIRFFCLKLGISL